MFFPKPPVVLLLLAATMAQAAPANDSAAQVTALEAAKAPQPEIAAGVGVVTHSAAGCGGKNQGTTLLSPGDTKCVNWSNAGSADFQEGTINGCNGGKVIFYHNTNCQGSSYSTSNSIPYGCQNLVAVSGGHGSGKVICNPF